MTFLYQDPTFLNLPQFDPGSRPGSVLQPTAPADGGINISAAAQQAPPAMEASGPPIQNVMTLTRPADSQGGGGLSRTQAPAPRDLAIAQMTGIRRFGSALGEFGAAVTNTQSPLDTQIEQVMQRRKMENDEQKQALADFDHYAKILDQMEEGPAKSAFAISAGQALDHQYRTPGLGDALEAFSSHQGVRKTYAPIIKYASPMTQALYQNHPAKFLAYAATKEGQAEMQTASYVPLDRLVTQQGSAIKHMAEVAPSELGLTPAQVADFVRQPSMDGLRKINAALPDGSAYKMTQPTLERMETIHDRVAQGLGLENDADHRKRLLDQAKIDANPKYIEIGAGKDAGGDLFVKAKPDPKGGPPIPEGTKYHKNPPMLAAPVPTVTPEGVPNYTQPGRTPGSHGETLKNEKGQPVIRPEPAGQLQWNAEAVDNKARLVLYDQTELGRIPPAPRKQVEERIAQIMKENNITSQDVVTGRAGVKADRASLNAQTKSYDAVTSFAQNAERNGKSLMTLADKVDTTGTPAIERWLRGGQKAIGTPDVDEFNAQMFLYRTEVAKLLTNPNLTGVLTVDAQHEVKEFMSGNMSAQSIRRVVGRISLDSKNRQETVENQMNAAKARIHDAILKSPDADVPGAPAAGTPAKPPPTHLPLKPAPRGATPGTEPAGVPFNPPRLSPGQPLLPMGGVTAEGTTVKKGTANVPAAGMTELGRGGTTVQGTTVKKGQANEPPAADLPYANDPAKQKQFLEYLKKKHPELVQ